LDALTRLPMPNVDRLIRASLALNI
jgi:hypothetical protein